MADIRNWAAFLRGRWDWTSFGYERGFPRGCQITDVDAAVEFDGNSLLIEAKQYDGEGDLPDVGSGQRYFLRDEVKRGKTVFVLWGCGVCNDPYAVKQLGATAREDRFEDWRGNPKAWRRAQLKRTIDQAMRLPCGDAQPIRR
jgi:hypothetical protein